MMNVSASNNPSTMDVSGIPRGTSNFTYNFVQKSSHVWTIDNFSFCLADLGKTLKSKFSTKLNGEQTWRLELKPRDQTDPNYMSLFLYLVTCNKTSFKAKVKFSILKDNCESFIRMSIESFNFKPEGEKYSIDKFITRDNLFDKTKGLLPKDILTLYCEIIVLNTNIQLTNNGNDIIVPKSHLSYDLGDFYDMKILTDVTLSVRGKKLKAHKCILAARSSVFATLFENDTMENRRNYIIIGDIKLKVFREMIKYMYTDKAPPNLKKMACGMLAAANMYALNRLKLMCENVLYRKISIKNAVDLLILADLHDADNLLEKTVWYINKYKKRVMNTINWKTMKKSHPHLLKTVRDVKYKNKFAPIIPFVPRDP